MILKMGSIFIRLSMSYKDFTNQLKVRLEKKGNLKLNPVLKLKIIDVCNKNDNPKFLMEAANWWTKTNELDHFEKAYKIKGMVEHGL